MANEIYNTSWWGTALDTARTAGTNPDFFGSQMKLLTSEQDNLVTNGDFATDSDWSKFNGATISGGKGNIIGDGSSFTNLTQSNVFTIGKNYKVTVDVTINSGLGLKFQDGVTDSNFGTATTSGSYTFYGVANNSTLVIGRKTGGTAFDSSIDNVSVQLVRCELEDIEAKKCLADWIHTTALKDLNN